MGIDYKKNRAYFKDTVTLDDAEPLLNWLQKQKKAEISFFKVSHIHTAVLQVLMAGEFVVTAWPKDKILQSWVKGALERMQEQQ